MDKERLMGLHSCQLNSYLLMDVVGVQSISTDMFKLIRLEHWTAPYPVMQVTLVIFTGTQAQ